MKILCNPRTAGFTLVELLVAITLCSFISIIVTGWLRLGVHAWHSAQVSSDHATNEQTARTVIVRLLTRVQPAFASADINDVLLDFAGSPTEIAVVAPLPDAVDRGIMARQRLALVRTPRGQSLVLIWRLDLPETEGTSPPEMESVLLDDVLSLRLRYWGAQQPGLPAAWHDEWQAQSHLPGLIDISIHTTNGGMVSLIVSSRVSSSPACIYYPIGQTCKRAL